MTTSGHTALTLYRRLLREARPYWPHIVTIFFLDLVATPLALLTPLPLKIAVDSVIGSQPLPVFLEASLPDWAIGSSFGVLVVAATLAVLIVLLAQLQSLGSYVLRAYTGERLTLSLRTRLFGHAQRVSLSFHDTRGTTDSIYRILYDAPSIQWITVYGTIPLVSSSVMLVAMLYVTARIDWQLALVALSVLPLLFVYSYSYNRRMRPRYRNVKELESSTLKVVQEVLTAVRVVKAFGREEREQERFLKHSTLGMRKRVGLGFAEGSYGLLVNVTMAIGTAVVLFLGVRNVQSGVLSLGELLMVLAYLSQLYSPLQTISRKVATMQSSLAGAQRAFQLLDEVREVEERPHAQPIRVVRGAIEFCEVSFAYNSGRPVVRGISFRIEAGTRLGILGRTGAGKTTLVSLLPRFYDPTSGHILLDGTDLRDYRLQDLRNQFAIVLQEPVLFASSIGENIAYGRPGADDREIVEAARSANAHDFIAKLPEGYDTLVGERGTQLSGGERQRVALARAFLKNAPILILDEPTSSVDMKTEAAILEAMERLMRGRTAFLIAHRPSLLESCDLLILIEDGEMKALTPDIPALRRACQFDPLVIEDSEKKVVIAQSMPR